MPEYLTHKIKSAIDSHDPNCSYRDLAKSIADVLKDEYGEHNHQPFIDELKLNLEIKD